MDSRRMLLVGAALAGLAVAAGAFGAHLLKPILDGTMLAVFETGVRYHMYHALALCVIASIGERVSTRRLATVGWLFAIGIILFSGSLYVISLSGMRWVGAFTPLGGAAPHSRLGAFGMDCCQDLAIAYGVQAAVRLPLIDPQPP